MKVKIISYTEEPEQTIVEIARVSSSRSDKKKDYDKLVSYLVKHKHWSPFEHAVFSFEIETSKAIAIQLLRHRSFSFQEFSQRYQDVNKLKEIYEPIELRKQAESNRQSSTDLFVDKIAVEGGVMSFNEMIDLHLANTTRLYDLMLANGVSRETARMILPMCTKTKIHMTGNIRSWIHFLEVRDDEHAQKEIQDIAKKIKETLKELIPVTSKALGW